jgi:hypothetical protein
MIIGTLADRGLSDGDLPPRLSAVCLSSLNMLSPLSLVSLVLLTRLALRRVSSPSLRRLYSLSPLGGALSRFPCPEGSPSRFTSPAALCRLRRLSFAASSLVGCLLAFCYLWVSYLSVRGGSFAGFCCLGDLRERGGSFRGSLWSRFC